MRKIGKFFFLPIFLRHLFLFIHIFQKNSFFFYNIHFYFISNSQNNHTFTLYYNHSKRETVFKQNSKKFFQKKIHSPIKFGLTYISFFIFYSFLLEHPSLGCSNFFTAFKVILHLCLHKGGVMTLEGAPKWVISWNNSFTIYEFWGHRLLWQSV